MRLFLLTALLLTPFAFACGGQGDLRAGNRAYEQEKYGRAYEYYEKAARKGIGAPAFYNLGAALYRLKDYEQAQKAYEAAAQEPGKLKQNAFFNAGNAAYMQKDTASAKANFRQAVLLNLKDDAAVHNMQILLEETDQSKKEQQNKEGDNKDKDNNPEGSQSNGSGDSQNQPPPQGQKLSKEEADNILQMIKDQNKKQPMPAEQGSGSQKQDKDW